MTRRAPSRSSRYPSTGEQAATIIAAIPNASDAAYRDHPNSSVTGFRKIPKVYTSSDAKLTNTPTPEAIATRHPG
jgi:transposase